MPDDRRYFAALVAAQELLETLDRRPHLDRPARLAIATYTILDAIKGDAPVTGLPIRKPER